MHTEPLAFTGHADESLRGLRCLPEGDPVRARVGVVLLSPPYAIGDAMIARARPLVEAGFEVLAPDLFSRERAEASRPVAAELPDRRALRDLDGALACLARFRTVDDGRLAVLGGWGGGTLSFLAGPESRSSSSASLLTMRGRDLACKRSC